MCIQRLETRNQCSDTCKGTLQAALEVLGSCRRDPSEEIHRKCFPKADMLQLTPHSLASPHPCRLYPARTPCFIPSKLPPGHAFLLLALSADTRQA